MISLSVRLSRPGGEEYILLELEANDAQFTEVQVTNPGETGPKFNSRRSERENTSK